jgi:hypothetical protein
MVVAAGCKLGLNRLPDDVAGTLCGAGYRRGQKNY